MQHSSTLKVLFSLLLTFCAAVRADEDGNPKVTLLNRDPADPNAERETKQAGVVYKAYGLLRSRTQVRILSAFSLLELLVVISILAVLAALLVPVVRNVLQSSRVVASATNLRTLSQGVSLYVTENDGLLPSTSGNSAEGIPPWWEEVYRIVYQKPPPPGFFIPSSTATNLRGTAFYCPFVEKSGEGSPVRSYGFNNFLKDGVDPTNSIAPRIKYARLMQPSKTLMLATSKNTSLVGWGSAPLNLDSSKFSARAGGKILIIFADGHADTLSSTNIPPARQDIFWTGYQ